MSSALAPEHPLEIYTPGWHDEEQTPVVDGKFYDRATGELRVASGHSEYSGPPAVDIVIKSVHEDTTHCVFRAARPFPLEALLGQIMLVIQDRKLKIDSLFATTYTIRVILAHELTIDGFNDAAQAMINGIWDQK